MYLNTLHKKQDSYLNIIFDSKARIPIWFFKRFLIYKIRTSQTDSV